MGTNLPTEVGQILSAPTSIDYNYPTTGVWDASYDICLDSTPKTTGVNQQEIMIWFNHQGSIQPVGSPVGNTTIEGKNFVVWDGSNGMNNAMAYVATEPIEVWSFDVMSFVTTPPPWSRSPTRGTSRASGPAWSPGATVWVWGSIRSRRKSTKDHVDTQPAARHGPSRRRSFDRGAKRSLLRPMQIAHACLNIGWSRW
ncbi:cellulase [Mycobacterium tuberculosis]|nr:cellulase [Mycobacterium tuberculosis]